MAERIEQTLSLAVPVRRFATRAEADAHVASLGATPRFLDPNTPHTVVLPDGLPAATRQRILDRVAQRGVHTLQPVAPVRDPRSTDFLVPVPFETLPDGRIATRTDAEAETVRLSDGERDGDGDGGTDGGTRTR
jgi:hypothetical protein